MSKTEGAFPDLVFSVTAGRMDDAVEVCAQTEEDIICAWARQYPEKVKVAFQDTDAVELCYKYATGGPLKVVVAYRSEVLRHLQQSTKPLGFTQSNPRT